MEEDLTSILSPITRAAYFVAFVLFALLPFESRGDDLLDAFVNPSDAAKPGVYWFFMDSNLDKEGMKTDLEAMRSAGLGRAIVMEADLGGPKGNVRYMTPEWLDCWAFATQEASKRGIELTTSVGPGWCGAGGPWISPERSMQHLRSSETRVQGGKTIDVFLPVPEPRVPYFGAGSLGPCEDVWRKFYLDVAVLAYPTPKSDAKLPDWEEKALVFRPTYSSQPGVKPYLIPSTDDSKTVESLQDAVVPFDSIIDVSEHMDEQGRFRWNAPEGDWTILRLGRRVTGQTTRPAPAAGLGLESDKFEPSGIDQHFANFDAKLLDVAKFSAIHHDSWEMSSQNWSENFRSLFIEKRGYDPLPWTPAMFGTPVESVEKTERFLWDLRRTAQELTYENNVERMKKLGAERGASFSEECYDLNPAGDLYLFRAADVPMCEFWAKGYGIDSSFTVIEAASSAHVEGKRIVGAESFTTANDRWRQHPGLTKRQADWAFCAGVNRLIFHRMCAQPNSDAPGLSLGIHGTHFDRTNTWFPLVGDYCRFIARVQSLLQRGRVSADVLFLDQEGAPAVFEAPSSAFQPGEFKDKREYNFDGCCPQTLIESARAEKGKIVFPSGASYSLLVLPKTNEITLDLARKLKELVDAGVPVIGSAPKRVPTLVDYPNADAELARIVYSIWKGENAPFDPSFQVQKREDRRLALKDAKWIWASSNMNAPAGERRVFYKTFDLSADVDFSDAFAVATADNVYTLYVNGVKVGEGNNFHSPDVFPLAEALRSGSNLVKIEVLNEGSSPNPAGLIACLQINDALKISTDPSWTNEDESLVAELGAYNMAPWNVDLSPQFDRDSTYPTWNVIVERLRALNVAPDFETNGDLRWIRHIDGDVDFYYVGNRLDVEQSTECVFRVSGKSAQLWNPLNGRRYRVDDLREEDGRLIVPIQFEPSQSWFVVFGAEESSELPTTSSLFAPRETTEFVDLSKDWTVRFCQNESANRDFEEGRAKIVQFDVLNDWSKESDDYLKYYSGLAVYEKTFDLPREISQEEDYSFEFDDVQVMAKVELNGVAIGTAWVAPYRVEIPRELLKPTRNALKITVANLWCNRLIGDASRPEKERFTRTSNPMWGVGDEQLLPSGLIGGLKLTKKPAL